MVRWIWSYDENGKLRIERTYINNKIHGIGKRYYKNGNLIKEAIYEYGEFIKYRNIK